MKRSILAWACLLIACTATAQVPAVTDYTQVDKKALQIPETATQNTADIAAYMTATFSSEQDKVRAIFIWIASTIHYDAANMFALNFYETKEDKIAKALSSHKGICEHYAVLFQDICTRSGIKAFTVDGYTKQNGFADYIPHAWCAARIADSWFLFDPTWGSGYVSSGKFIPKISNNYFMVPPAQLVKSHMPFDYLWQCLNYPVSNQEFYENTTQANTSKPFFSYPDSIAAYEQLTTSEQLSASARRIEQNGIKNSMIFDRLRHIRQLLEQQKQEQIVNLFNSGSAEYNEGVNLVNTFIQYRNNQFKPHKPDAEIKAMLDSAEYRINAAQSKIAAIKEPDASVAAMIPRINKSIDNIRSTLQEQQHWLQTYLAKGKASRPFMFYKATFLGKPTH